MWEPLRQTEEVSFPGQMGQRMTAGGGQGGCVCGTESKVIEIVLGVQLPQLADGEIKAGRGWRFTLVT